MPETTLHTCKNCGNQFRLKYCNYCGQKAGTGRITWTEVLHHLPHAVFHVDGGFLYTIKELLTRPGHTAREYLEGKRKHHFNPFMMLVLLSGLCSYLYVHYHLRTVLASISLDNLETQNATIAHKYFALRTLFFCLVCSIGDFLLFRKYAYNFPEMVVANTFMFCGVSLLHLLFMPLLLIVHSNTPEHWPGIVLIIAVLLYQVISRYQFYKLAINHKGSIAKIIAVVLLYFFAIGSIGQVVVRPLLGD